MGADTTVTAYDDAADPDDSPAWIAVMRYRNRAQVLARRWTAIRPHAWIVLEHPTLPTTYYSRGVICPAWYRSGEALRLRTLGPVTGAPR